MLLMYPESSPSSSTTVIVVAGCLFCRFSPRLRLRRASRSSFVFISGSFLDSLFRTFGRRSTDIGRVEEESLCLFAIDICTLAALLLPFLCILKGAIDGARLFSPLSPRRTLCSSLVSRSRPFVPPCCSSFFLFIVSSFTLLALR